MVNIVLRLVLLRAQLRDPASAASHGVVATVRAAAWYSVACIVESVLLCVAVEWSAAKAAAGIADVRLRRGSIAAASVRVVPLVCALGAAAWFAGCGVVEARLRTVSGQSPRPAHLLVGLNDPAYARRLWRNNWHGLDFALAGSVALSVAASVVVHAVWGFRLANRGTPMPLAVQKGRHQGHTVSKSLVVLVCTVWLVASIATWHATSTERGPVSAVAAAAIPLLRAPASLHQCWQRAHNVLSECAGVRGLLPKADFDLVLEPPGRPVGAPNVLLVLVESLGNHEIQQHGFGELKTWASSPGVFNFSQAVTTASVTEVAAASVFTGVRYGAPTMADVDVICSRTTVISPDNPTLTFRQAKTIWEHARGAGYSTFVYSSHHQYVGMQDRFYPGRKSTDMYKVYVGGRVIEWCVAVHRSRCVWCCTGTATSQRCSQ